MIWDNAMPVANSPVAALAGQIAQETQRPDFSAGRGALTAYGDDLPRAVADFALARSNGLLIPSDYLLILTCRALWAVGDEPAARNLLRERGPEFNIPETYAAAIFSEDLFFCLSGNANFLRGLRSSSSVLSSQGPYWILKLGVFFSLLEKSLELTVWRVLRALLGQLGELWDASQGQGVLGLKDAHFISTQLLGLPRQSKQGKKFINEAIQFCGQVLALAAVERGWQSTPAVINLDA